MKIREGDSGRGRDRARREEPGTGGGEVRGQGTKKEWVRRRWQSDRDGEGGRGAMRIRVGWWGKSRVELGGGWKRKIWRRDRGKDVRL